MSNKNGEGFLDGFMHAFRAGNIFFKVVMIIFFGILTATPYLIYNLDQVKPSIESQELTGLQIIWAWFSAIWSAMWKGVWIGLSTVFNSLKGLINGELLKQGLYGTLVFSVLVVIFATMMVFQPVRLFTNSIDMKKDKVHSDALIYIISLAIVLVVLSPLANWTTGGMTITSGVNSDADFNSDGVGVMNDTQIVNNSNNLTVVNVIDLLADKEEKETWI